MTTYYEKNKEKIKARRKEWLKANPDKRKEYNEKSKRWREENRQQFKDCQTKWMEENPYYYVLNNARKRAKEQKVPYSLSMDWLRSVEIPDVCPYLGIPIIKGENKASKNSPSLDKIKPHLGYVPGNVEFISMEANRMKGDFTLEQIEMFAKRLRELIY